MQQPLQISWRNVDVSESVEANIREHLEKLEQVHNRITSCRVVVEAPHMQHQQGNLFRIMIDIVVPGGEVVVDKDTDDPAHEDVYVAIRDAFNAARRQLKAFIEKRQGR
ncbi:MAG: ribosome-associated translation inhibitor RaiA [Myxococcales bacterium]|nr:ribosome-associated translation inhibitor RaiA [Myxococcales bacterium]